MALRGQLGAVVADDRRRLAALGDEPVQFARHPHPGQRGVGDQRQAFPRAVVDHRQDPEAPAVESADRRRSRATSVGWAGSGISHRRPRPHRPLAAAAPAHGQPLLAIEPEQPLVVHHVAFPAQQDVQAPIAKAPALMRPSPSSARAARPSSGRCEPVAHRHPAASRSSARPPLAHLQRLSEMSDRLSPGSGRHHFFPSSSFKPRCRAWRRPAAASAGVLVLERLQPLRVATRPCRHTWPSTCRWWRC